MIEYFGFIIVFIGLLGLLMATLLIPLCFLFLSLIGSVFPTIGRIIPKADKLHRSYSRTDSLSGDNGSGDNGSEGEERSLAVVIPVHNDAEPLRATLESLAKQAAVPGLRLSTYVVLDNCSDDSESVSDLFEANKLNLIERRGKWQGLCCALSELSKQPPEACLFLDAGTVFTENFLRELYVPLARDSKLLGVAPRYRSPGKSLARRAYWKFESYLKSLENFGGGATSLHGAAVCYRFEPLQRALKELEFRDSWLNDDVVIPLMIRALHPERYLLYLPNVIAFDSDFPREGFARRGRIVQGNLEWIRLLLPRVMKLAPKVALVSLRRVFRTYWAYSVLAVLMGVGLLFAPLGALVALLVLTSLLTLIPSFQASIRGGWRALDTEGAWL